MITYSISELRALMGELNTIEEVLEAQKTLTVQLMDIYENEMKIEPEWSSTAYDINQEIIARGREFYEDIYGEINQTLNRISRLNQSITLFLAKMSGLDDEAIQKTGLVTPVGVDFSLSRAEVGQQDNATNFRYDPKADNEKMREQMYPGTSPELNYELTYHRNRENPLLFDENGRPVGNAINTINDMLAERGYGGLSFQGDGTVLEGDVKEGQIPLPDDINTQITQILSDHEQAK